MINVNQKGRSTKETRETFRAQYSWHLRAPFTNFDREHWWERQSDINKIEPEAALYELARRHPIIGALRSRFQLTDLQEVESPHSARAKKRKQSSGNPPFKQLQGLPSAVHCLCLIGLKTWRDLTGREMDFWIDTVGSIKGVDCRSDLERCCSLNNEVIIDVLVGLAAKLKHRHKAKSHTEFNRLVARDFVKCNFSDQEYEQAIAEYAKFAIRNDYLVIAVARDLRTDEARLLLERQYREHQRLYRVLKQRSRYPNWLPLISEFENNEITQQKDTTHAFVRYRRAVDLIHFPNIGPGVHPTRCRHILAARDFFLKEVLNSLSGVAGSDPK
jgi:hypothetical protein